MKAHSPALAATDLAADQTVFPLRTGCSSKAVGFQPTRLAPEDQSDFLSRAEALLVWTLVAVGALINGWLIVGLAEVAARFV